MSLEFRSPKATIECPLGTVSANKITVNVAINTFPTVTFTAYTGEEAASRSSKVLSKEVAALMGKAQTLGFSRRTDPDTTLKLDDGGGGKLTFEGFLVSPSYMMTGRSLVPGFAAVDKTALLSNLKLDGYNTSLARATAKDTLAGGLLTPSGTAIKPNLAQRLKELTEKLIEKWQIDHVKDATSTSATLKEQQHKINSSGPLEQWYELLDNSVESLANTWLPQFSKKNNGANEHFNNDVLSMLRGTSRDFQEIIGTLCSTYQMLHVPGRDGKAGKLVRMEHVITSEAKKLALPVTSMLLSGNASHDLLPLQQVLVQGYTRSALLTGDQTGKRRASDGTWYLGGFPSEPVAASGEVVIVGMPSYMLDAIIQNQAGVQDGTAPPSVNKLPGSRSRVADLTYQYVNKTANEMVTDYCKQQYIDRALGGNSCSIQLPANLQLWPGDRYEVNNDAGELLFTGFLAGVTHTFSKDPGGGSAVTEVNFTHIVFPGFTLPGF